jgi:radical SAM protein with 4Fe4S-binding SPASM domain
MAGAINLLRLTKIFLSYFLKREVVGYMPLRLWIETTGRCNLKCAFCMNKDLPPDQKKDMDTPLYKKIIDEAAGDVYDVNLFHRGEPLLHPDIADMIAYAEERNIRTRIHTNATLLDEDLDSRIIYAGLDMISFSFDGYTAEEHEKNRKGADFKRTLENIKGFLKIKKEMGSKKPETVIQIMETASFDKTLPDRRKAFIKRFEGLPPDRIITRKPHNWGGLLKIRDKSGTVPGARHACTFPWYSLTIFSSGMVYPCPQDFMGSMPVGDINKSTIKEIFNGDKLREIRKMFASKNIKEGIPCSTCDRIRRNTFMGIPLEYLHAFLRDNLKG